jgi:hypothetical protein
MNPTKNRAWTQVLRKDKQFLLHMSRDTRCVALLQSVSGRIRMSCLINDTWHVVIFQSRKAVKETEIHKFVLERYLQSIESFQQHSINQETNLKEGQFNIGKMNSLQL